jgi:hypothetical protein
MQIQGQARVDPGQFQSMVVATGTNMKSTPTVITDGAIVLSRKKHPVWTIVLAVVLFPIGLLFLLIQEDETTSVQYSVGPGGIGYSVSGDGDKVAQAIGFAMQPYSPTAPGWPPQLPSSGGIPLRPDGQ